MKRISILMLIFLHPLVYTHGQFTQNEKNNVKKAAEEYYIKGLKTRNFDLFESICIDEAKLYLPKWM